MCAGAFAACGPTESHPLGGAWRELDGASGAGGQIGQPELGLCTEGARLELIDDMEDQRPAIIVTRGRAGQWFSFNDGSVGAEQVPGPGIALFPMSEIEPPRDSSRYAVNTYGSGFSDWGAGVGFELLSTNPYDASGYAGVAFWARIGPDSTQRMRFSLPDRNTSQYAGICDLDCQPDIGPSEAGLGDGTCQAEIGPCYDDFGAELTLSSSWQQFIFSWAELEQRGWSGHRHEAIVSSELYGFRFQLDPGVSFDVWIDDVAFVCP